MVVIFLLFLFSFFHGVLCLLLGLFEVSQFVLAMAIRLASSFHCDPHVHVPAEIKL